MNGKNIDYWKKIVQEPPASFKEWFNQERKYLNDNISSNTSVLDIGCGDGRNISDLALITENIIGIDYNQEAVRETRKKFINKPDIKIICANAINLPFENEIFNFVVFSGGTFGNFDSNKKKVLLEAKRVVKKNGFIIISVYSENAFKERMKVYKKIKLPIKEIVGTTMMFDKSVGTYSSEQFSKEELENLFETVKLKLVEIVELDIAYICKLAKK